MGEAQCEAFKSKWGEGNKGVWGGLAWVSEPEKYEEGSIWRTPVREPEQCEDIQLLEATVASDQVS